MNTKQFISAVKEWVSIYEEDVYSKYCGTIPETAFREPKTGESLSQWLSSLEVPMGLWIYLFRDMPEAMELVSQVIYLDEDGDRVSYSFYYVLLPDGSTFEFDEELLL